MLILTRNTGERIVIEYPNGDKVILEAVKIKTSTIMLGAEAPLHIPLVRYELVNSEIDSTRE